MPKKKFTIDQTHGYIGETKSKIKPKPYVESEWLTEYRKERDICWFIQYGGECAFSEEEVKRVRSKYFKDYQIKLL